MGQALNRWNRFILLVSILALPSTALAGAPEGHFDMGAGYRTGRFSWDIAGNLSGRNPTVLSELIWSDLEIFQVKASGRVLVSKSLRVRASAGYGWIFDGDNRDSDYLGDNRTGEFSRSDNSGEGGNVLDASLGMGREFAFRSERFRLTPFVGISYHEQNLRLSDGFQSLDPYGMVGFTGPFDGLDSSYDARWLGPWVGLELAYAASEKLALSGCIELHGADYSAEADWNLRDDFAHPVSFRHDADGYGFVASVAAAYSVGDRWSFTLGVDYEDWSTGHGIDRVFLADGTQVATRLNGVDWESSAVTMGARLSF